MQILYITEGETKSLLMENVALRIDTMVDIPVPPNLQGKTVHVWLALLEEDLTKVSISSYAGSILIT